MKRLLVVTILVLLASGCGGGSGYSTVVPQDVAEQVGCSSSYRDDTTEELFVEAVGTCTFDGKKIRLLTFTTNEARDHFERSRAGSVGVTSKEADSS